MISVQESCLSHNLLSLSKLWDKHNSWTLVTFLWLSPYLKCSNCYIHGQWCSSIQKVKNVHFLLITRYGKWSENILNTFLATFNTTTRQEQNMKYVIWKLQYAFIKMLIICIIALSQQQSEHKNKKVNRYERCTGLIKRVP